MILEVKDLYKNYGKKEVLRGVNLSLPGPGVWALVGPNGSGKTTLFNTIAHLTKAQKGTILIDGMKNSKSKIFTVMSYLKDNTVLYDSLTGRDHLSYLARAHKKSAREVEAVIERMEIASYVNRKTGTYSLGMKQRLLWALALLPDPKLIMMDEPLTGLDHPSVLFVRHLIRELEKTGKTILLSSHTLSELDYITDRIFFLKEGKILEEDLAPLRREEYIIRLRKPDALGGLEQEETRHVEQRELSAFLEDALKQGLTVLSVEKKIHGAESRYHELFGIREDFDEKGE